MAARRAGAGGGLLATLIVFVILFVFAAVMAVLFYTNWQTAEQRERDATDRLERWATAQDQARPELSARVGQGGSVASQLQAELDALKNMVVGSTQASIGAIEADAQQAGVRREGGETLLAAMRRMNAEHADVANLLANQRTLTEAAEQRVREAEQLRQAAVQQFEQARGTLNARIDEMQEQVQGYDEVSQGQRETLAQQLEAVRTQANQQVLAAEQRVTQMQEEVARLRAEISELKPTRGATPVVVRPHLQPDGEVLSVPSQGNLVYINRGRSQRIVAGLTFEVFDQSTGVVENEFSEARGKATIEVVNVGESTSVARIVRTSRGRAIREGDLIVNAVYDPNQIFKFVVFGEFDIDNIGQATVADRRRIETMIREWGGVLAERMTYDTDFLVLGREPQLPEPLPPGTIDPVRLADYEQQVQRYEQYQELITQAAELGIPVLNQNRFLQLVGHYQR